MQQAAKACQPHHADRVHNSNLIFRVAQQVGPDSLQGANRSRVGRSLQVSFPQPLLFVTPPATALAALLALLRAFHRARN